MPEQMQLTEEQRRELEEKIKNMSPEELKEFQKQQCIFCQIIAGKVPSKKVYEDENCLVVLDINPAARGHLLIIPKEHYAIMPQIPDKEIGHLFLVAKKLSQVVLKTLKVDGTNIFIANGLVAGQRAQHFMLHLLPRKSEDHLLNLNEKIIDKELRRKVKFAVEKRLNELLGIKKEVVDLEEKNEGKREEIKKINEMEKEGKKIEKKFAKEILEDIEEEKEEIKELEKDNSEKRKERKEEAEKKTISKIKEKRKKEEIEEDKSQNGVSLDDIANLFK